MDREGFRNRMKQYKEARGLNPLLKYWEWKDIPKYDEGTNGVTLKEKEDAFWRGDTQKMAELVEREGKQLTYITPESNLNELVVTANRPKQNQYSELDFVKDVAGFTPIGDVIDLYDAGKALYKGNYSEAAMLAAGLLLPNWLEKSGKLLKRIWKGNGKTIFPSNRLRFDRPEREVNRDLFDSQFDLEKYLQSEDVQNRMKIADSRYGTKYKANADYIRYFISETQPNINYENSLFLPSELTSRNNVNGEYTPAFKRFSFNPAVETKEKLSNVLHHETQHFLDDVSGGVDPLQNRFLLSNYTTLIGTKSLPRLYFDYGLQNILTKPIKTAKSALRDKYYLSKPTEIRAYFSTDVFKPRYENGISFDLPFSKEDLNSKHIQNILLSQKDNGTELLERINKYGFAEGGEVEPNKYSERPIINMNPETGEVTYGYNPAAGYLSGTDELLKYAVEGTILSKPLGWLGNKAKQAGSKYLGPLLTGAYGDDNDNMLIVNKSGLVQLIKTKPIATNKIDQLVIDHLRDFVLPKMKHITNELKQEFLDEIAQLNYNIYPSSHFKPNVAGYRNKYTGEIAINEEMMGDDRYLATLVHELRHLLDAKHKLPKSMQLQLEKMSPTSKEYTSTAGRLEEKIANHTTEYYNLSKEFERNYGRKPNNTDELNQFIDKLPNQKLFANRANTSWYGGRYNDRTMQLARISELNALEYMDDVSRLLKNGYKTIPMGIPMVLSTHENKEPV